MKALNSLPRLRAVAAKSPITLGHQAPASSSGAFFVLAFAMLVAATAPPIASAQAVAYAGSGQSTLAASMSVPLGKPRQSPVAKPLP